MNISGVERSAPEIPPKTVAIVGSHPHTCNMPPWDDLNIKIWGFNKHALTMPRFDMAFQMHTQEIYLNKYGLDYVNYWKVKKNKPLIMRYPYNEFPDSVPFPMDDILELTSNVLQGKMVHEGLPELDLLPLRYFTSSINYAIAYAILEKYHRIDIYGVEMTHRLEWYYQRENFTFWVGYAAGQGIDLQIHCANNIFQQPLYEIGASQYKDDSE